MRGAVFIKLDFARNHDLFAYGSGPGLGKGDAHLLGLRIAQLDQAFVIVVSAFGFFIFLIMVFTISVLICIFMSVFLLAFFTVMLSILVVVCIRVTRGSRR